MNFLMPPSREEMTQNLRLLAADWRQGGALMRYFVISQMVATTFSVLCSAGSFAALAFGQGIVALGLVCVAGACLFHAIGTWNVLKRRYQVRFAVWL
jgi:succinate dehydrogenase/fumarate reductase cytochrome b subunit